MARKPKIETAETVANEAKRRAAAVLAAAADDFATLTRAAGLDPARHWCRVDLRGIDFGDDDLFGFKFVGACVIDLVLDRGALSRKDRPFHGARGATARRCPEQDRGQHGCGGEEA